MSKLTPQIIANITDGTYIGENKDRDIPVKGAVRDNRDVKKGNLFICIRGARVDGHSFADIAFEAGAACCLTEQDLPDAKGPYVKVGSTLKAIRVLSEYYRSLFKIPVIGITGSVGKTSAKELIAAVLSSKFNVLKTEMNLNNEIGVPLTLLALTDEHEVAVIEMGIRDFGDMDILAQMVRPDIFVMTKIGYSHIKELGDLQGVLRAKTEAFAYMKPDGIAVMNGDDELLLTYETKIEKLTYGLQKHNDVRAINIISESIDLLKFDIADNKGQFSVNLPAYGTHLATLAPGAVIIGRLLGMTDDEICRGFLSYAPVEGRSNIREINNMTLIDDCYNANPNSVKAAITSMSSLPGRHVAILGDMLNLGEHSKQMHYDTGVFAAQNNVDCLLCHGNESIDLYKGFIDSCNKEAHYYPLMDDLIEKIPAGIKKGDVILVKASRGMQFEKLLPFISRQKL